MTTKTPIDPIAAAEQEIAQARASIAKLLERKRSFEEIGYALEAERAEISFAALAEDDPKAKARLAEIHRAAGEAASEAASLDAAAAEAERRLNIAEQHLAREHERDNAREVLRLFEEMEREGLLVDEHVRALAAAYERLEAAHRKICRAGCGTISHQTFWALTSRAIRWILRPIPHLGEFVAPAQRAEIPAMLAAWGKTYTGWAVQRLGDGPIDDELEPAE